MNVSVPVAGYASLRSRLERPGDIGDIEQNPTDLLVGQDYSHFTAMRAPRPTLLVYNAEDDCCFRAPLVKPYVFRRRAAVLRTVREDQRTSPGMRIATLRLTTTSSITVSQAYSFFSRALRSTRDHGRIRRRA